MYKMLIIGYFLNYFLLFLNQIKVISTWNSGINANKAAIEALKNNKSALDAVELGLNVIESDPENTSVGIGEYRVDQ